MLINNLLGGAGGRSRYLTFNQAAVQEMTLETGGMSAASETGGNQIHAVPKEGGNNFKAYFNTSGTNGRLQNSKLFGKLRAPGLSATARGKQVFYVGGP